MPDTDTFESIGRYLAKWIYWPLDESTSGTKAPRVYCPLCETSWLRGLPAEHDETCPIGRARALLAAEGVR